MGKILIVDDEPDTLVVTELFLKSHGFDVFTASNAADAMKQIEAIHPDLVVTDFMMPGLSGVDLCLQIRARDGRSRTPIIMSSAAVEPPPQGDDLFDVFIPKPTYFDDLLREIARLLDD